MNVVRNLGAFVIIVLLASVVFLPVACKKGGPSDVEITVVDIKNIPVEGALVRLTAPASNGKALAEYLPDEETTGSDGKTYHSFPLEAVLTATVTKGTLSVDTIVRLKREESITQTIILW